MRQRIRLTEGDLHRIVKESVKRVIREDEENLKDGYLKGRTSHGMFTVTNGKCDAVINYQGEIFVVEKNKLGYGYNGIEDEQPFTDSQQAEDVCRRVNMMLGTTNFRVEKKFVGQYGVALDSPLTYKRHRSETEPEDSLRRQRRMSIQGHLRGEKPDFNGQSTQEPYFTDYGH